MRQITDHLLRVVYKAVNRDVLLAPLDMPYISSVHPCNSPEFILGQTPPFAE